MKTYLYTTILLFFPIVLFGQSDSVFLRPDALQKDSIVICSKLDSSSQRLLTSLNNFNFASVDTSILSDAKINDDSLRVHLKKLFTHVGVEGTISVGHDYGLLTGYIDTTNSRNLKVFRTNGDLAIKYLGIPVNFSYNYSTLRNPLGANNYFRFSLDTDKLNAQVEEKKQKEIGDIDQKLSDVKNKKGQLNGKIGYTEVVIQMLKNRLELEKSKLEKEQKKIYSAKKDVLNDAHNKQDYLGKNRLDSNKELDSLQQVYNTLNSKYQQSLLLYDSVNKIYSKVKDLYSDYQNIENQLSTKKMELDRFKDFSGKNGLKSSLNDSLNGKKTSFLSSIKTLDFGLTYPQTSGLSKNSAPIKGLNIEIEHNKWYYAFAAGITLNNVMVSTDVIANKLTYSENLFNQFDFQKITKNGFLIAAKSGYGTKDGTHAFLGIRYLTNSKFDIGNLGVSDSLIIPSVALELDLRWKPKFSKNTSFDLIYGKTSASSSVISGKRDNVIQSMFSNDRTNTGLLSVKQSLPKLKTDVITSIRILDPLADMRSLGVLQPNNIRYEVKTNHAINKQVNLGFTYRYDRNNIDNRLDTTAGVNVIGTQIGGRIGKKINYSGNINLLNQKIERVSLSTQTIRNYIIGVSTSYIYEIEEIENALTFNYNDFLITDQYSTGKFRTIGLQNATLFDKSSNVFSMTYFSTSTLDSLTGNSFIIGDEFTISTKRMKLTSGIKYSFSSQFGNSWGGKIECLSVLTNYMDLLIRAERFVLGSFYNSYDRNRFNKFPYLITAQLNFKIK